MADEFLKSALDWSSWSKLRGNDDDDSVDRLNHIYTVVLLVLFALFTGGGQYVANPITCWCPAYFKSFYVDYTKSYCWIKNTYFFPMQEVIPSDNITHQEQELTYYQWVPVILLFMAFLFKFPCFVWRILSGYSGINLNTIVTMTAETQMGDHKKRDETVKRIANYLDTWLKLGREYHTNMFVRMRQRLSRVFFVCGRREGTFLTGSYLLTKLLYVINIICHFFILDTFLGGSFDLLGAPDMNDFVNETTTRESGRFPLVTLCDLRIRQLENIRDYTVQCVLPINLFNEKIFTFLWFWFVLVAVVTCASFLVWFYRVIFKRSRLLVVKKYLKFNNRLPEPSDKKLCRLFADHHLRDDGIFVLRIVEKNSNSVLMADLVTELWDIYSGQTNKSPEDNEKLPQNNEDLLKDTD